MLHGLYPEHVTDYALPAVRLAAEHVATMRVLAERRAIHRDPQSGQWMLGRGPRLNGVSLLLRKQRH